MSMRSVNALKYSALKIRGQDEAALTLYLAFALRDNFTLALENALLRKSRHLDEITVHVLDLMKVRPDIRTWV